jgi:transcriptional regulator with XRE-family HTH domain
VKKTAFMEWVDGQIAGDAQLAREVDELLAEMRLDQEIAALREKSGLSQRAFAARLGTSQPYVAKLESGRIKNLGVRTLIKAARAAGGTVNITITSGKKAPLAGRPATTRRRKTRTPVRAHAARSRA